MQLGSGTFDITLGSTFKGNIRNFSWGLQQLNTFRTGINSEGYRFGNLYGLHAWSVYAVSNTFGVSARLSGRSEGDINGANPELNPMMVPPADPANYGGEVVNGAIGLNILLANNKLVRGTEVSIPLYQNYNGIFMSADYVVNGCIKYAVL
jgi:hypothetical protein